MPRTRGKTRSPAAARGPAERVRSAPAPVATTPAVSWTWALGVAGAAVAVYLNSLGGALLYDDINAIRNNPFVRSGDVVGILTEPSWWGIARGELWRPLTTLTFALDHALHGLDPFGYHVVNVVLHAAVSVLVLLVFAAATLAPRAAFAAALLFATHPIHTEAVASVVGRAELLAAGGFFLAWRCWIAADAARAPAAHRRVPAALWLAGAAAAYFLAMCGKETAIVLPAVLVAADLLVNRGEPPSALLRRRFVRYAVLAATAVFFVTLRASVLGRVGFLPTELDNPLTVMPFGARLMTAIKVVALYALRLVFPLWLSADYSFDQVTAVHSPLDAGFLAGVGVFAIVALAVWWGWRRLPALALGAAVLAFPFAIVGNLFFLIGTLMGERLAYLPSAGFCLMGAAGLAWLSGDRVAAPAGRVPGRWPAAFVVPLIAIVTLYGARTVARNPVWREPLGFYSVMVEDAPRSARSHRELANALADLGRLDDARREFDRSLAIKPEDPATIYNYGNALSGAGRFAEAADLYRRAVAINPAFAAAWENLGNSESMLGNNQVALEAMQRALELEPRSAMLNMNIANTFFRAGNFAEAKTAYERALALEPTSPEVLTNYGSFLYARGEYAVAVSALERIPSPQPVRAIVGLVMCYHALGRATDARAAQATAERLYPQHAAVRQTAEMLRNASGAAP